LDHALQTTLAALPRDPLPDHVRVYDAIADGDAPGAQAAMRVLVDLALEDTQGSMPGENV